MKIGINFHTYDDYISGVDYYTLGLIKGLLSIDNANEYVIYTNRSHLFERYVNAFSNVRIHAVDGLIGRIRRICWEHFMLPWLAKNDKLNVLHCPSYITPLIKVGVPYVVTVHDTFALDSPQWCKWSNRFNYGLFMPKTSFKADAILAVSQQTRRKLLQHSPSIDPTVIYPGIDKDFMPDGNSGEAQKIKEKYQLPDHYLLYVGNIEPKKNLLALLKAYKILRTKCLPHKLVLVGKRTWRQNDVWDYIRNNFFANEIILTGYADREDLPGIYRQAEVFVFPSLDEGFGFPALESMRCGTPVVASPVGILKELPEKTFCRVNPNDAIDIAAKICSMVVDSVRKTSQIELALKRADVFPGNSVPVKRSRYINRSQRKPSYMKRRIAYILTTYPCKSETFICNEISLLKEKGLEIVIFAAASDALGEKVPGVEVVYRSEECSMKIFLAAFRFLFKRPTAFGRVLLCILKYLFYDLTEGLSLIKNISTILSFSDYLKRLELSHIHGVFLSWPGRMSYILSKATGLSYSLAAHARDGYVEGGAVGLKVANAEFVMCCTQAMASHIRSEVNVADRPKVHTSYHGVSDRVKMQDIDSSDSTPTLIAIGRFVKKKGFDSLVTTFRDVLDELGNVNLLLIGDGPESDNLKDLVQKYGITKHVVFAGWLCHQEALLELSQSSLLVVPSVVTSENDMDGIPNVILEAFMLKVPVIASSLISIQEAIVDGDNGLLFEPGNHSELKEKIKLFFGDESLRTQIAERAFENCTQKFNALTNIEKLHSLFYATAS